MRLLKANEIQVKVKAVFNSNVMLLIYKDARVDMAILDETYGVENWTCSYREIKGNLFCTISVWDKEKKMWISKEDVGVESRTEGEKGEASDSFKRAGTKWGIGRELYTAPRIYVNLDPTELNGKNVKTSFYVSDIEYINREISYLVIVDQRGNIRFTFGKSEKSQPEIKNGKISKQQAAKLWDTYDHDVIKAVLNDFDYKGLLEIEQSELERFEEELKENSNRPKLNQEVK
jgi:hypothetical protein